MHTLENLTSNPNEVKSSLPESIAFLATTIKELKDDIQKLLSENILLRKEVEDLKNNKQQQHNPNSISEESIIEEAVDRINRSSNVVISGLPDTADDNDNTPTVSLLNSIVPNLDTNHICSIYKIGKFTPNRSRLVKVKFINSEVARTVLRSRIRKNNIYINADLTKTQQNIAYKTRKEYRERLEQGEKDIILKYVNGLPRIARKN